MSPDQRAEILRGIEAGEPVLDILARLAEIDKALAAAQG